MECSDCKTQNPERNRFCRDCGAKLSQGCPECGAQGLPGDKFCGECGKKLSGNEATERTRPGGKVVPMKKGLTRRRPPRALLFGRETGTGKAPVDGSCRVIALCNQKGGVGKTVTAINLSAGLAASGLRTLLVDVDPQGLSGLGLGLDTDALERSAYDVLLNGACPAREAIVPVRPNLEILPSNMDLALAELEFAGIEGREGRLREVIDGLREAYGYIVIDCPPSVGILTINALVASQVAIVPVAPSSLSVCGLSRVLEILDALKELHLLDLRVYFLTTFFEKRQREARHHREELERTYGEHLLKTVIRKSTRLNEATREGVPIFEYDRRGRGSRDYADLAAEILAIGSGEEGAAEDAALRRSAL